MVKPKPFAFVLMPFGPEFNDIYRLGIQAVAKPVEHFPENIVGSMIDNDFEWAASNRKEILAEWQKRYDSKSEPKS